MALVQGCPEMFNTDQGVQFTSLAFTGRLERAGIAISMDGRGRALDNIFVERVWRTVKDEDIYLKDYASVPGWPWASTATSRSTTMNGLTKAWAIGRQPRSIGNSHDVVLLIHLIFAHWWS
jgi:transposase InsO family protein